MVIYLQILTILKRWKNYSCHILNVHGVNDVKQTEMHTAEPLVSEPMPLKVEITTEKLKRLSHPVLIKFFKN
jgi:hypothetical protein